MRVTGVSLDVLEVPLRTSLATASADWTAVRLGLLSLRTDTGLTGLGRESCSMDTPRTALTEPIDGPS